MHPRVPFNSFSKHRKEGNLKFKLIYNNFIPGFACKRKENNFLEFSRKQVIKFHLEIAF